MQALKAQANNNPPPFFAAKKLERASGNRLFYVGLPFFSGQESGLTRLPSSVVNWKKGRVVEFSFVPPGEKRKFLAVANPLYLGKGKPFGALIVATPQKQLNSQVVTLLKRLALALLAGLFITAGLAYYLSGRITRPVRRLVKAADEVAEGRYDVIVPDVPGRDEIADLADSFRQMASRLRGRGARAQLPDDGLARAADAADRDPRHVEALREGLAEDPAARTASLDVIAAEAGRLERLVGDVLDLAKLDAHRFTVLREEVDMARLLERAHALFAEEAKRRGIDYDQDVGAEPVIFSDGDRVLQIITNLLANAFRWTPDGGRVDLRLRADDGHVSVAVEDNGPGINARSASASSGPSGRTTGKAQASAWRSLASWPSPLAAALNWIVKSAGAAASSLSCRLGPSLSAG